MTAPETLLDPTGMDERTTDSTLAPRPGTLRGLTVGLLDNTKANATALLENIAQELRREHGAGEARLYTKDYFGTPVKQELLEQITEECDVVITAVGDCGSCSAATVADGVLFERAGVPTVSICSDSFLMSGSAMAGVQGFPGFDFLTVKHPVASLDAEQIHQRAVDAVPDVLRILGVEA
ncbi:UGSC family (seleno)protein [Georgenia halophila]|uniref:UGSC family (Seleno)protein n=1 Tax=Georgenia halophila TaxID=620889 RepID=A0ABP8KTY9_9MICO